MSLDTVHTMHIIAHLHSTSIFII